MKSSVILAIIIAAIVAVAAVAFVTTQSPSEDSEKETETPDDTADHDPVDSDPVVPSDPEPAGPSDPEPAGPSDPEPAGPSDPEPAGPDESKIYEEAGYPGASQWPYFGGDIGSLGVTDSKTPVTEGDMSLAWKVYDPLDQSAMSWKVPSSAICIDDRCYYYRGSEGYLYCCDTSTGNTISKAVCKSSNVYNMAMAYGEGKVFVCTSTGSATILKVFDADSMDQLYVSVPVEGGEVQGPATYYDGKLFFGTYSGGYACFETYDRDTTKGDEVVQPLWILDSDGWYNAVPAFFDNMVVLVQRGFGTGGAIAYLVDSTTGVSLDTIWFDMEYASSGAVAYEGRVYIPLNRVIDRSTVDPDENTPEHLAIRSYSISDGRFDRSSERFWESDCSWGGTQCVPVAWNGSLYIGGGGKTLGTDEPFWILDIADDGSMSVRERMNAVNTKSTASITTAYSTEENGYAVYIYLIEYGHVFQGEAADSSNGYADIFVLRDSKTEGTQIVAQFRPEPTQFAFQSFTVSPDGHVIIRNDTTLLCYGTGSSFEAADVDRAVERFLSMAQDGHANYSDYQRIAQRYASLDDEQKAQVKTYGDLLGICSVLTVRSIDGDSEIRAPNGCTIVLPEVSVPAGKVFAGWISDGKPWIPYSTKVSGDAVIEPVYADAVTVTIEPDNGEASYPIHVAEGGVLPYINDPSRDGYEFGGWFSGSKRYVSTETKVSGDIVLTARWLKVSTLLFDTDGGTAVTREYNAVYSQPIGDLPSTVKPGYSFGGWFYDGVRYDTDTVYAFRTGITLKAAWTENDSGMLSNGKGITVSGKLAEGTTMKAVKGNPNGSTVKAISAACEADHGVSADCVMITLKGDGISSDLVVKVAVEVDVADGTLVDVYYKLGDIRKTVSEVSGGKLVFEVSGSSVSGGVQIVFGVPSGTGILERV